MQSTSIAGCHLCQKFKMYNFGYIINFFGNYLSFFEQEKFSNYLHNFGIRVRLFVSVAECL